MAQISIETWEEILQNVKEKSDIPDISFRTWIQPLKVQDVRDNTIAVLVTTGVMGVEYISKKYLRLLKTAQQQTESQTNRKTDRHPQSDIVRCCSDSCSSRYPYTHPDWKTG